VGIQGSVGSMWEVMRIAIRRSEGLAEIVVGGFSGWVGAAWLNCAASRDPLGTHGGGLESCS